jgi:hypothetical protein
MFSTFPVSLRSETEIWKRPISACPEKVDYICDGVIYAPRWFCATAAAAADAGWLLERANHLDVTAAENRGALSWLEYFSLVSAIPLCFIAQQSSHSAIQRMLAKRENLDAELGLQMAKLF